MCGLLIITFRFAAVDAGRRFVCFRDPLSSANDQVQYGGEALHLAFRWLLLA